MEYKDSGVDIDKASEAMKAISGFVKSTWGKNVLSEVGQFGGLFRVPAGYEDPVLVASMDGVGTKIMVARQAGRYDTVGQDLVNHCVNDILVQGGRPLFFLDYLAAGSLEPRMMAELVRGLGLACGENGCALIGGETAEMPGLYQSGDFDLAGTIVGVVERSRIIDGSTIEPGDAVFALPASGLHTNGYSLVRRLFFDELGLGINERVDELGRTVAEELLRIHVSYLKQVSSLSAAVGIKGLAHITGGGVVDNLPRILPGGCGAHINEGSWPAPPVFGFIRDKGGVSEAEMYRVFNMGLGMLAVVGKSDSGTVPKKVEDMPVYNVGEIVAGDGTVEIG
jgi:phosphoribosylformylglycinamidine cyclo-ligase